jgi:2-polyprenyl-3-methyl-5-hydroxy-6-metoxy-1,4-benzoquinol methylase
LKIYGVDPNPKRVQAAAIAFGECGEAFCAGAPDFVMPGFPERFDAVFCLDVIHFLPDEALALTLGRIRERLDDGGILVLRAPMLAEGVGSVSWNIDRIRRGLTGAYACYRTGEQVSDAIANAGFTISQSPISGTSSELRWFIGVASAAALVRTIPNTNQLRAASVRSAATKLDEKRCLLDTVKVSELSPTQGEQRHE